MEGHKRKTGKNAEELVVACFR